VDVDLVMLGATVVDGVSSHVDGANIVVVDHRGQGDRDVKFLKKLPHPTTLSDEMRDGAVFGLSAGVGDHGLVFGGPRHQIITKEDAEAGGGVAGVRVAHPISIGVDSELVDWASAHVKAGEERALHIAQDVLVISTRCGSCRS
jgi:hypothetical protein